MSMYSDVDRLRGILKDLAGLVNEPNSLPDTTRDYINVRVCMCVCMFVCVCVERERERERGQPVSWLSVHRVRVMRLPTFSSIRQKHDYKFAIDWSKVVLPCADI